MKVLVTGGTGNVGVAAVQRLVGSGHTVTVIGRRDDMKLDDAAYARCDINDYETLVQVMKGHDTVVHLAAIPSPIGKPGRELFRVDALGTFNVFEAAAECGITRVVAASSINAFGLFYGDRGFPIRYLPVDENHPGLATDAYSFSKQVMESIGRYFWDRDGISSVMLRLPGVFPHEALESRARRRHSALGLIQQLLGLPDREREAEILRICAAYDRYRRANRLDKIPREKLKELPSRLRDVIGEEELSFMHWRANLFTYVDELDSAQAIEKGLTAGYDGSHPIYVNASKNSLGLPVEEVAKLFDPPTPEVRPHRESDDTIVSIDHARALIGFKPDYVLDIR